MPTPASTPVRRVLCFAAHPDDIDFGAAGTIAAWTDAGVEVSYCILTDGDAGGFSEQQRPGIIEIRRHEQRAAARLVGVTDISFLGQPDGFLEASPEVIRGIVKRIREVRPDVVMAMHPERNWDRIQKSHPDHLACGEAVTRAVYPASENPYAFPELAALSAELRAGWGRAGFRVGQVTVEVIQGDARETLPAWQGAADAWFLDGFSPAKNPELWSDALMAEIGRHTAPGGSFATYTAAGHVRRALAAAGFTVERAPGFAGKRHMSRGVRP